MMHKSLKNNLGRSDQDKVSEYLESIYSVEKRISNTANKEKFAANITPDIKSELVRVNQNIDEYVEMYSGVDVTEKTRLMLDIMALAFWSDASRVSTFMFGNSVSNRNFSFLDGVKGNHHSISHHMDKKEALEEYCGFPHGTLNSMPTSLENSKVLKKATRRCWIIPW